MKGYMDIYEKLCAMIYIYMNKMICINNIPFPPSDQQGNTNTTTYKNVKISALRYSKWISLHQPSIQAQFFTFV